MEMIAQQAIRMHRPLGFAAYRRWYAPRRQEIAGADLTRKRPWFSALFPNGRRLEGVALPTKQAARHRSTRRNGEKPLAKVAC
jgi:hypothetical protein